MSFVEAGPRRFLSFPDETESITVGIVVSGGIAPGINAVISGIVERHSLYANRGNWTLEIKGYREGFKSLVHRRPGHGADFIDLSLENIVDSSHLGGSILPTSRIPELLDHKAEAKRLTLLEEVANNLLSDGIQILYVIGGDGSMRLAHALSNIISKKQLDISIIAIPKTMDNDILWVWQSFGFLSSVEWANKAIRQLYIEVSSNPRFCVIQLFGSDSGFVVSHAALASGVCDMALIPEVNFTMQNVVEHLKHVLIERHKDKKRPGPYGILLVAETAIPCDVCKYITDTDLCDELDITDNEIQAIIEFLKNGRRVTGDTPDDLRKGGLKIITGVLQREIRSQKDPYWSNFRVFSNEPRHLIRSISPSSSDVIFGNRLGALAVDCALAGYSDFMISQWLTEYIIVPLGLVVLGRKRIPEKGIFWKTVRDNTGQPQETSINIKDLDGCKEVYD